MGRLHDTLLNIYMATVIMDHSLKADLLEFDNPDFYDKLQRASVDSYAVAGAIWGLISATSYTISFTTIVFLIFKLSPLYALLLILCAIPSAIVNAKYTRLYYNFTFDRITSERQSGYYKYLSTEKRFAQEMRIYNVGETLKAKYQIIMQRLFSKEKKLLQRQMLITTLVGVLPEIASFGICTSLAHNVLSDNATIGDFSLYSSLLAQAVALSTVVINSIIGVYDNKLRISNIKGLQQIAPTIKGGTQVLREVHSIEFKNVTFRYPRAKNISLDNVTFQIRNDTRTIFVGESGSGKSTIVKLILRFYDPNAGTIFINGVDIKEYTLDSLRNSFSVYFQNAENYSLSLYENICLSDLKNTNEKNAKIALKNCCLDSILLDAPMGLETPITRLLDSRGLELSVGQGQRLALSRVLFKKAAAYIFDEPSSSIDPKIESRLLESIEHQTKNHLTIIISHRYAGIRPTDRVLVFKSGRIVGDDSFSRLARENSEFKQLYIASLKMVNGKELIKSND